MMKKFYLILGVFVFAITFLSYAICMAGSVTKKCTAENQYTTAFQPASLATPGNSPQNTGYGQFNVSVYGYGTAFTSGKVSLLKSYDGTTYYQVVEYTSATQAQRYDYEPGVYYKIGVDTGEYGFGSFDVRLSQ